MMNWKGFGRKQSWSNFEILSWHSPGQTEENQEKLQDSQSAARDLNLGPAADEGVTIRPQCLVIVQVLCTAWELERQLW
jgi:hypothetical protein